MRGREGEVFTSLLSSQQLFCKESVIKKLKEPICLPVLLPDTDTMAAFCTVNNSLCLFVWVWVLLLFFAATSCCFSWDVCVATWGFGEAWCGGNIISEHDLTRFQRQTTAGFHLLPSSSETECHLVEVGACCSRWRLLYSFMARWRPGSPHRRVDYCVKGFTWPSLFKLCSVHSYKITCYIFLIIII